MELPAEIDQPGLLQQLRQRARAIVEQSAARPTLVRWLLTDGDHAQDTSSDQLAARLRQGGVDAQLLNALRVEFGSGNPCLWSMQLTAEPSSRLPAGWYEEDTILGDLLRIVQQHETDRSLPLPGAGDDPPLELPDELQWMLPSAGPADRERLLRHVAALGVDLLRGDRVLTRELEV